jgi:hypothetical protein
LMSCCRKYAIGPRIPPPDSAEGYAQLFASRKAAPGIIC